MKNRFLKHTVKLVLFANLGALTFISKKLLEWAPNIHFVGVLIAVFTVCFSYEALIPIYVYVFLDGLFSGFNIWWIPYLYVWALLWLFIMLVPRKLPNKIYYPAVHAITALYGLLFGTLYAPMQALFYKFSLKQTFVWILNGLPYDFIHCVGNLVLGTLIFPLSAVLLKMKNKYLE